MLAVDSRRLAVRVGLALVGVKHLDFVQAHQVYPAIAAILILAVRRVGSRPFHVKLAVAESLLGLDVSCVRRHLEVALLDLPWSRPAFDRFPGGKIFPVEKNNSIGGRLARLLFRTCLSGCDHRRLWRVSIVLRSPGWNCARGSLLLNRSRGSLAIAAHHAD